MKFNERYKVNPEFEYLFKGATHKEDIEMVANGISARFLNEIEQLCKERNLLKKDLAKNLKMSASYITQLYSGDKRVNLVFLAKVEDYFKITFEIQGKKIMENLSHQDVNRLNAAFLSNPVNRGDGVWVYFKNNNTNSVVPKKKKVIKGQTQAA